MRIIYERVFNQLNTNRNKFFFKFTSLVMPNLKWNGIWNRIFNNIFIFLYQNIFKRLTSCNHIVNVN